MNISIYLYIIIFKLITIYNTIKDFPKERYHLHEIVFSNLYTKYPSATYSGLLLGTMICL